MSVGYADIDIATVDENDDKIEEIFGFSSHSGRQSKPIQHNVRMVCRMRSDEKSHHFQLQVMT